MPNNRFRGDATAVAEVWKVTPANVEVGDQFTLTINGKALTYTATAATVANVVTGLVALIQASTAPEWLELTAAAASDSSYLTLTANTAGKPTYITSSTTNSESGSSITVVETTKGVSAVNEIQKISLDGTYSGGTFTITWDFGSGNETTGAIAYNASAATVQAAIEALATPTPGDVSVTGSGPWYVEFKGAFAATEVAEGTVDGSGLTGTNDVVVETTQNGFGGADSVWLLSTMRWGGPSGSNAGTFTLTVNGETTSAISYNATAAQIQTALEALSSFASGDVEVTGFVSGLTSAAGMVAVVRFTQSYAGTNVSLSMGTIGLAYPTSGTCEQLVAGGAASWPTIQVWDLGGTASIPTGTDLWNYGITGDSDVEQGYGQVTASSGGTNLSAADPVYGTVGAGDYYSYDQARLEFSTLYNATITCRAFVAGNGFITVHDGTALGTNVGLGLIGTAGVSSSLARSASVTKVLEGGSGTQNEIQSVVVQGSGGTFTLTFDGQTTGAISYGALASAVDTALEALSNIPTGGVSVSGSGTTASPYLVTFTGTLAATNVAEMTGDGTSLTGGSGQVTETTSHVAAVNEVQTITLDAGVSGGTFTLSYGGETTSAIPYNDTAANIKTALEALSTIAGVTVGGSAGGPWTVTFDTSPLAGQDVVLLVADGDSLTGGSGTQTLTVLRTTDSAGKWHANDPTNWTLGRVPETGDTVILDAGSTDMRYGLEWLADFTADASADTLTISAHNFAADQKVRVSSTGTLPTGLSASTDYYVILVDQDTIQLSASRGGSAINLTSTGSGTHTIAVEFAEVIQGSRYTGKVGLAERNTDGTEYYEFRPRFWAFGMLATGGTKTITLGSGEGSSSQRINLNTGTYDVMLEIFATGGGAEAGVPAALWKGTNAGTIINLYDGDLGIAFHEGETAQADKIYQRGGQLTLGKGHVQADLHRTDGEWRSNGATFAGTILSV